MKQHRMAALAAAAALAITSTVIAVPVGCTGRADEQHV